MIQITKANERHFSDMGWLKTYWLFSFSDYFDPNNMQFGNLRVFNDDWVKEHSGFQTHPHAEMEIVTVVMNGELTHEDSMGNTIKIGPGEVQRMSAGTGIRHSEMNRGDEPVELYQIWFLPQERNLEPSYDQRKYVLESFRNTLKPLVTGDDNSDNIVTMHSDATIYRSVLDASSTLEFKVEKDRGVFIYITEGILQINDETLSDRDQARITGEAELIITANEEAQFMLIDVTMKS